MVQRQTRRRTMTRGTELLLWITAALCLGWCAFAGIEAYGARQESLTIAPGASQRQATPAAGITRSATASGEAVRAAGDSETAPSGAVRDPAGKVIGRIEIPELRLSVPMTAGIESASLLRGVGHIEGTAQPGGLGTLGLAGHRDTYFRPLRRIAAGMEIRVVDRTGVYHYTVDTTEIVMPEQVAVLAIRDRPELTLVTCYPFDFVGAAPQRFIVHAHLLSAAPDARPDSP